jgi:RiboL-PSP-HEPN
LRDLHSEIGGTSPGRRYGLEVLNKSAVVLITAIWEAFCEDLASEAVEFVVDNAKKAELLPYVSQAKDCERLLREIWLV